MKKNIELTDKGTILAIIIALCVMYMVGFLTNGKFEKEVEFTKSDIQAIENAMGMYGDTVVVMKNKKGDLIINLGNVDWRIRIGELTTPLSFFA